MNRLSIANYILPIACFCALFISNTTAKALGINSVVTVSLGPFLTIALYYIFLQKKSATELKRYKLEFWMVVVFLAYAITRFSQGNLAHLQQAFTFMALPMIISWVMQKQNAKVSQLCARVIIALFFAECFFAIYEKYANVNIFPNNDDLENPFISWEHWQFRSTALLGHPLMNALCTSTILGFILVSNFGIRFKYLCLILGGVALLCFNARGATLVFALYATIFIVNYFRKTPKKAGNILTFLVLILTTLGAVYYILTNTSLGGRIINDEKIMDGSAKSRFDAFKAFGFLKNEDLWVGNPDLYLSITEALGAAGVENSYIMIIIRYGLVFGIPIILLFLFYVKRAISRYNLVQKTLIVSSFLLIGSLNNSLSSQTPWILFVICSQIFPHVSLREKEKRKRLNTPQYLQYHRAELIQ